MRVQGGEALSGTSSLSRLVFTGAREGGREGVREGEGERGREKGRREIERERKGDERESEREARKTCGLELCDVSSLATYTCDLADVASPE